jgi:hypothetical protein
MGDGLLDVPLDVPEEHQLHLLGEDLDADEPDEAEEARRDALAQHYEWVVQVLAENVRDEGLARRAERAEPEAEAGRRADLQLVAEAAALVAAERLREQDARRVAIAVQQDGDPEEVLEFLREELEEDELNEALEEVALEGVGTYDLANLVADVKKARAQTNWRTRKDIVNFVFEKVFPQRRWGDRKRYCEMFNIPPRTWNSWHSKWEMNTNWRPWASGTTARKGVTTKMTRDESDRAVELITAQKVKGNSLTPNAIKRHIGQVNPNINVSLTSVWR